MPNLIRFLHNEFWKIDLILENVFSKLMRSDVSHNYVIPFEGGTDGIGEGRYIEKGWSRIYFGEGAKIMMAYYTMYSPFSH